MSRGEVPKVQQESGPLTEEQRWQNTLNIPVDLNALFDQTSAFEKTRGVNMPAQKLQAALAHMGGDFSYPRPAVRTMIADLMTEESVRKIRAQRDLVLGDLLPLLKKYVESPTDELEYFLSMVIYAWVGEPSQEALSLLEHISDKSDVEDRDMREMCTSKVYDVAGKIDDRLEEGNL